MTVYPNVVQIDNGRPLHISTEQYHANRDDLMSDVPVAHPGYLTLVLLDSQLNGELTGVEWH